MKTKTWLIVLGVCAIVFGSIQLRTIITEHQATSSWNTCSNPTDGYQIKYPTYWATYNGNYDEILDRPKLITTCDDVASVLLEQPANGSNGSGSLYVNVYNKKDVALAEQDANPSNYSLGPSLKIVSTKHGDEIYVLKFLSVTEITTTDILSTLTFTN